MKLTGKQKERLLTVAVILGLTLFILGAVVGIFTEDSHPEKVTVSVIVEDKNSARWVSFQQGLESAAEDAMVDLTIVPTGRFTNEEEEANLVRQRVDDGADGIILAPVVSEELDTALQQIRGRVGIVLVENDIPRGEDRTWDIPLAAPDHAAMGAALFRAVEADRPKGDMDSILMLAEHCEQPGVRAAEAAIRELAAEAGISHIELCPVESARWKQLWMQADVVLGLDDAGTMAAAAYADAEAEESQQEGGTVVADSLPIYGIGSSDGNVIELEQGVIRTLIVPNEFRMGYLSLSQLAENIRNHRDDPVLAEVGFMSVSSEDVHDPEIEKLLYPVIQ